MKRHVIIGAFFGALVAILYGPAWSQNVLGPSILVQETKFNPGKVREGKTIGHTFKVVNKGDKDLIIGNVKPG